MDNKFAHGNSEETSILSRGKSMYEHLKAQKTWVYLTKSDSYSEGIEHPEVVEEGDRSQRSVEPSSSEGVWIYWEYNEKPLKVLK